MSNPARVQSIDSLKEFKAALRKFIATANVALGDCESEMHRVLGWLERDAQSHWEGQIRKRTEVLGRAKEALRQKKLFKGPGDHTPAAVEEEKAVRIATQRLAEAEQKLINTKTHSRRLQKEISLYKGGVQRLATAIQSDLPVAAAKLEAMILKLEEYLSLKPAGGMPGEVTSTAADQGAVPQYDGPSMARPEVTEVAPPAERTGQ